jgi:hypothetical protein
MTTSQPTLNRQALERVAHSLGSLLDRFVFIGENVAELLVTDPAAVRIRATDDVDVIVAVTSRAAYYRLGEELRGCGFVEDTSPDAPLCRWRSRDHVVLDVMPTDETILGFTNQWYPAAIEHSVPFTLAPGLTIRIAPAPVFLATKWAAYDSRGANDLFGSHDIEDIITVVAGRPTVLAEIAGSEPILRTWLAERTRQFLAHPLAGDAIAGALPDVRTDPALVNRIRDRLRAITDVVE